MAELATVQGIGSWRERLLQEERASAAASRRLRHTTMRAQSARQERPLTNYMPATTLTRMLSVLSPPEARVSAVSAVQLARGPCVHARRRPLSAQPTSWITAHPYQFPNSLRCTPKPAWSAASTPRGATERRVSNQYSDMATAQRAATRQHIANRKGMGDRNDWDLALAALSRCPPPARFDGRRANWR